MERKPSILRNCLTVGSILLIGLAIQLLKPERSASQATEPSGTTNTINRKSKIEALNEREKPRSDPTLTSSQIFDLDGEMDERLLALAGISADRRSEVEAIFSSHKDRVTAQMATRVQKLATENEKTESAYRIPSDPIQSSSLNQDLTKELESHFGRGAARILVDHLTKPAFLAGSGRYDLTVKSLASKSVDSRNFHKTVQILVTDPDTGETISDRSTRSPNIYKTYLGDLLNDEILAGDWNNVPP